MESVEGPRAWTIALRRHVAVVWRVLREEPPGRWPTSWHAFAACTLALASACAAYAWDRHLLNRYRQAAAALALAKQQLQQSQRQISAPAEPPLPLLERHQLEQVVSDLGHFASARSLRLGSLQLEYSHPAKGLLQVRFSTTVTGDYPGIKSWLGELLARYPSLALQSLSMRAQEGRPLEAAVALNLYMQDRP